MEPNEIKTVDDQIQLKKESLLKYLKEAGEVSEDTTIEDINEVRWDRNTFEIEDQEWSVLTADEAEEAAHADIEESINELGLEAFTEDMQTWILNNALDADWFDEACREGCDFQVENMSSDEVIEWGIDHDLTTEDEAYGKDEDGEVDYSDPNYDIVDDIKARMVDDAYDSISDPIEWFRDNFGEDAIQDRVKDGSIDLDIDAIVDECIRWDGIGHFVSRYDGEEVELDNDFFGYRQN